MSLTAEILRIIENALRDWRGIRAEQIGEQLPGSKVAPAGSGSPGVIDLDDVPQTFLDLSDTPSSYSGQAGKVVAVNAGATGLEFVTGGTGGAGGYAAAIGDGTSTTITVTHSLGSRDVLVEVWEAATPFQQVFPTVKAATTNTVTLEFLSAPTAGQYRCVVSLPGGSGTGGGGAPDYLCYEDQKTAGTGGGTFTSGSWVTRDITTEVADAGGHGSLSSNEITLAAGTYEVYIQAPGFYVNRHRARLYNVTGAAVLLYGSTEYSGASGNGTQTYSIISGRITLGGSAAVRVEHRCDTTKASNGLGIEMGGDLAPTGEVFTRVELRKVA